MVKNKNAVFEESASVLRCPEPCFGDLRSILYYGNSFDNDLTQFKLSSLILSFVLYNFLKVLFIFIYESFSIIFWRKNTSLLFELIFIY